MRLGYLGQGLLLGLLALLLAGCGSEQSLHGRSTATPVLSSGPVSTGGPMPVYTGGPQPIATGNAASLPPPVPSVAPTVTVPPLGPTPGPDAVTARLIFTPTLAAADFALLIRASGIVPVQIGLHTASTYGGGDTIGGSGMDPQRMLQQLDYNPQANMRVSWTTARLDRAQAARLEKDPRVITETDPINPAAGAGPIVARWRATTDAIRTVRGHQQLTAVHPDGAPADLSLVTRDAGTTDEVIELGPNEVRRFHFVAHRTQGDLLTLWDGTHAYRYWSWLHEVYRPVSDAAYIDWDDNMDDEPLTQLLFPAPVDYSLVGSRTIDGHAVFELLVASGPAYPQAMRGTRVFLDATTYLPYRIAFDATRPGGKDPISIQHTFALLEVNGPVTATDFAATFPPDTVAVVAPYHTSPHLETYPDLHTAAQRAGFPLYTPPTVTNAPIYAAYYVEIAGQRSPVIAFNNGAITEGRYLPSRLTTQPSLDPQPTATPLALTSDGHPATLTGGVLTFSRGATQIRITGVQTPEQAQEIARSLQPVP